MDYRALFGIIICSLLCVICAMLNFFFIYCLWCLQREQQVQQGLKHLLTWCVVFNIFCNISTITIAYTQTYSLSVVVSLVVGTVYFFFACTALVSPSWLSVFYYLSIVPQKFCIMLWAKRNIRWVVFCFFVMDGLLVSAVTAIMVVSDAQQNESEVQLDVLNLTNVSSFEPLIASYGLVLYVTHCQLSFWTLALTWGGTFIYLHRHLKAMKDSGSSTLPTYQSQRKISIIGLVQAGFFLPCCLWVSVDALVHGTIVLHYGLLCVCACVGLINSVCLGLMQSVFREQVLNMGKIIWNKLRCV